MRNTASSKAFLTHILTMVSGSALSQIVSISFTVVLARVYTPADYGVLAAFVGLGAIIAVVGTLRLENALIVEPNEQTALFIREIILALGIIAALLSYALGTLFRLFSHPLVILFAISTYLTTAHLATSFYSNRKKLYNPIAKGLIGAAIFQGSVALALSYTSLKEFGLIIALVVGQAANLVIVSRGTETSIFPKSTIELQAAKVLFKKYRPYTLYLIPSGILEKFSSQAYLSVFSLAFGESNAGQLSLYQRLISLPTRLVGKALSDVFRSHAASDLQRDGNCRKRFFMVLTMSSIISIPCFLSLQFFARELFVFIFGSQWALAGYFAERMSWIFLFSFIVFPVSSLIHVGRLPIVDLVIQIYLSIATAVSLYAGWFSSSIDVFFQFLIPLYCFKYVCELFVCWLIASGYLRGFNIN